MEMFAPFQVMLAIKRLPAVVASQEFAPVSEELLVHFQAALQCKCPMTVVTLVWAGFMRKGMVTFQFAL